MGGIILLVGLVGMLGSLGYLVFSVLRKRPKKSAGIALGVSAIAAVIGIATSAAPLTLSVDAVQLTTDAQGAAVIKGETSEEATLHLDGEEIKNNKGTFSETIQLDSEKEHTYVLKATLDKEHKDEKIVVTPSKEFVALLEAEQKEKELLAEAETALVLAESEPNQKNFDEAATLVEALSKTYDDHDERLATIKENIAIYLAVETAEKSLARKDFDEAKKQVELASLNKEDLVGRVTALKTKVEEKEAKDKLYAEATKAVENAEKSPSKDAHKSAADALAKLPAEDEALTKRVAAVQQTVKKQEELALKEKQEQEQREKEQLAQAEQAHQQKEANQAAAANQAEEHVLVTRTGKKYHTYKCGNGDYYEATLSEALGRGLTQCSKCY
ncbi:hypothetical protein BAU15_08065 [Enterococcus sp. JM4C]|uniref:hypothetical protein n=1 Tax=Candidatus Enterococcus huntleyi TaxID=1857217 RepID=UPI001379988E|nr:hypothetical protein [Enterococcus sp. JM4C]KAF1297850.1 hypothetical protein BAU15_08065 [Enterococcus sp. JM4C]